MQKAHILKTYNKSEIYAKDGQGNSTISDSPDPEFTTVLSHGFRVELLTTDQFDSPVDFFMTKWENDWEPTVADVQGINSNRYGHHSYHSKPRWLVKGRSLITNQLHVGWVSSKHLLEVITPQVDHLIKAKQAVWNKAKQDADVEAEIRRVKEAERRRQEELVTAQLTEQFAELTGKRWDFEDFSLGSINTKLEYFDRTQSDGTVTRDAKVKTEGDVRVSYDAWMVLMTKLQQLYDSMDD